MQRRIVSGIAESLTFSVLVYCALAMLIVTISHICGYPLQRWHAAAAGILTAGALALAVWKDPAGSRPVIFFGTILVLFGAIAASTAVAGSFFDITYDGQMYHQSSVISLARGWIPVHDPDNPSIEFFSRHFPRGIELCAAVIYSVTGALEKGKAINFIMLFAAFTSTLSALLSATRIRTSVALLISLVAALNPVTVNQLLSYYIDGTMGAVFCVIIALLFRWFLAPTRFTLPSLASALVVFLNIKFPAVAYAAMILAAAAVVHLFRGEWKRMVRFLMTTAAACIVALTVAGFSPFVTNALRHAHPLYPVMGSVQIKLIDDQLLNYYNPQDNRVTMLFQSVFSASDIIARERRWKIPLTYTKQEIRSFFFSDVRVGGFGPWFGAIAIVSLSLGAVLAYRRYPRSIVILVTGCSLLATVLVNPGCWWARWVPQLWLVPVLVLLYAVSDDASDGRWMPKLPAIVLAALMLVNIVMINIEYWRSNAKFSRLITLQLDELKRKGSRLVYYRQRLEPGSEYLRFVERGSGFTCERHGPYYQNDYIRLDERSIPYTLAPDGRKPDPLTMVRIPFSENVFEIEKDRPR